MVKLQGEIKVNTANSNEGDSLQDQELMVEVKDLVKIYQGNVKAVDGISFSVSRGEFFGFLGPNGAGKTTTMKILGTLAKKTKGVAKVLGVDVDRDPNFVRSSIGFALQEISLDHLATGRETLVLQGVLYHLSLKEAKMRADELLELFGLADAAHRRVGAYSGGMRRRLDLASALVHKPKLLFLDEPTEGLDPQSRGVIWQYLQNLNREGVTIFLTTHYMEEADRLCNRLAIIDMGKIVVADSPENLKKSVGADTVSLKYDKTKTTIGPEAVSDILGKVGAVDVKTGDSEILVFIPGAAAKIPELLEMLSKKGLKVESIAVSEPSLNDVFLKYTGHQIRDEDAKSSSIDPMMQMWIRGGTKR